MLSRCLPLLLVATLARAATLNVTGDYTSNYDDVHLDQEGKHIHGTYVCCGGGTIDGKIEGRIIHYRWDQPGSSGRGVWKITGAGRLEGTWGSEDSETDG